MTPDHDDDRDDKVDMESEFEDLETKMSSAIEHLRRLAAAAFAQNARSTPSTTEPDDNLDAPVDREDH